MNNLVMQEILEDVGRKLAALRDQLEAQVDQNEGVLTFKLPQNKTEMQLAMNARKYLRVLEELDRWCRDILKYRVEDPYVFDGRYITLEDLRTKIRELMEEEGVSLEDGE